MIWLKIIARKRLEDCGEFSAAISECNELIAIFVSSTETADGNGWFSQSDINNHQFPIPSFPTPPVTAAVLESEINSFATAKAAQAQGGTAATAAKNNARGTLAGLLQQLAFYVQVTSNDDLTLLLSTGFEPVSQNRTQTQLAKPTLIRIKNGLSGQSTGDDLAGSERALRPAHRRGDRRYRRTRTVPPADHPHQFGEHSRG